MLSWVELTMLDAWENRKLLKKLSLGAWGWRSWFSLAKDFTGGRMCWGKKKDKNRV